MLYGNRRQKRGEVPVISLVQSLNHGLSVMDLDIEQTAANRMLDYLDILAKWNRVYNLTAVRKPEQMLTRHLLDSLAILPFVKAGRIIDVGSGAGLPGIPLALAMPESQFVLLDSNSKKTRFLQQAKADLELDNLEVVHDRVEEYRPEAAFDTVVSRAYSSLSGMLESTAHLLAPEGINLAMKGVYPLAELDAIPSGFKLEAVEKLEVPGLDADRHLVILHRE
ncbi:MAG: 16S rRNA (guanine(527)-N(7))-methyltransferase RsmG [Gammaproteobacteria bacterium]|nr:16S rRNA (guanine(527)-N(7))-methyltransferase RsmG [Gammaproteobacteria bacterium]